MSLIRSLLFIYCFILTTGCGSKIASEPYDSPSVVVSLKPLYGLVSQIMDGVGKPILLLPDYASPHTFQIKPSQRKTLENADLIIWMGPEVESFMEKALVNLNPRFGVLTLSALPSLVVLPQRTGRDWGENHAHDGHDHEHHIDHSDQHLWLSPQNARLMGEAIAQQLIQDDPQHSEQYKQNLHILNERLTQLDNHLKTELLPFKDHPFLVYHDGYQYFEKAYGLNGAGTLIINPNVPLSAKGLFEIQKMIEDKKIKCVFTETEFKDIKMAKALKNPDVKIVELDPLGAQQNTDNEAYENTLKALGKQFQSCWASEENILK